MAWKRFYTKESNKLMLKVRMVIIVLTSPLWLPLYLLSIAGHWIEILLDYLDDVLQRILDKVIPQIK